VGVKNIDVRGEGRIMQRLRMEVLGFPVRSMSCLSFLHDGKTKEDGKGVGGFSRGKIERETRK